MPLTVRRRLCYFALLALAGRAGGRAARARLTVFGQKMTHALRSRLMAKDDAPARRRRSSRQEPGALAARFVGDVDTVEALFTSGGIVGMAADACRIISAFWR